MKIPHIVQGNLWNEWIWRRSMTRVPAFQEETVLPENIVLPLTETQGGGCCRPQMWTTMTNTSPALYLCNYCRMSEMLSKTPGLRKWELSTRRHQHLIPYNCLQLLFPLPSDTSRADIPLAMKYQWHQDLSNPCLWQKKAAAGEQPQGAQRLQHQNPPSSSESEDASAHGEAENVVHTVPQPWEDDPGGYWEGRGSRSPWNMQEAHMWPHRVQQGSGKAALDASFCGIWSRSTSWV